MRYALISLILLIWGGFCIESVAKSDGKPTVGNILITDQDTLDASPWIEGTFASWQPGGERIFCVSSFHTWPHFFYLRHMELAQADSVAGVCGTKGLLPPLVLQLEVCPDRLPFDAPWAVVQCGERRFRFYSPPAQPSTLNEQH